MVSSDFTAQEKHRAERDKGKQPSLRLTMLLILISLFSEVVLFNILLKQTVGTTIVFREPSCQHGEIRKPRTGWRPWIRKRW